MSTISGTDIKREITQIRLKKGEQEALLSGFVRSCLALKLSREHGVLLELDCQTDFVREYVSSLMLRLYKVRAQFTKQSLVYTDYEKLLRMLGIFGQTSDGDEIMSVPERFEEFRAAYVRGMFLGCGSFSAHEAKDFDSAAEDKQSGRYHLEFSFVNERLADDMCEFLRRGGIVMRKMGRGEKTVLYSKVSAVVCDCLALMRLDKMVLKLNDTMATMSYKKTINRRINCEMANMTRVAHAAVDVAEAIDTIDGTVGLETLNPKLLEAAEARINSPDKSLGELAYELGVSKSGLKHRYDRILQIAATLKKQ